MKTLANIDLLRDSLSTTKKAIILLGSTPNFDIVASALGFAEALKNKGIDVQVASLTDMRVEFSRLVGVDQVRPKIGNKNLIVSFDYNEDQVEKVSYQISDDGKRFNLVIAPKTGVRPLQPDSVQFEFAGADAQFVALFGVNNFMELGELYEKERALFDGAMTVGFTLFPIPPFLKCHLDASGVSSLSELVAQVCQALHLTHTEDSASNLLAGIDAATQEFRSPVTSAETFEAVADLVRAGAVRQPPMTAPSMTAAHMPFTPAPNPTQSYGAPSTSPYQPTYSSPPPVQANTNQFAQLLGNAQGQSVPTAPPIPSEYKG